MKKFLKGCLLIVLSFVSLFMFLVTVAVLKDDSTSTENSTSVETDKTAEKNLALVETKKTDFKPSENSWQETTTIMNVISILHL